MLILKHRWYKEMSKFRNIALLSLVVLTLSVTGCSKAVENNTNGAALETTSEITSSESTGENLASEEVDPLTLLMNETYTIEGQEVTLVDGKAETEIAPDSATKMKTEIWGDPLISYLDNGTIDYAAVILISDGGGSGTFYYVASPIHQDDDYYISDAVFIGDRIEIESITTEDGQIVIDYLKHGEDQAMAEEPTEKVQDTFIIVDDILYKSE